MDGNDFFEGVRTALIDKKDKPKWTYNDALEVPESEVSAYFSPHPTVLPLKIWLTFLFYIKIKKNIYIFTLPKKFANNI